MYCVVYLGEQVVEGEHISQRRAAAVVPEAGGGERRACQLTSPLMGGRRFDTWQLSSLMAAVIRKSYSARTSERWPGNAARPARATLRSRPASQHVLREGGEGSESAAVVTFAASLRTDAEERQRQRQRGEVKVRRCGGSRVRIRSSGVCFAPRCRRTRSQPRGGCGHASRGRPCCRRRPTCSRTAGSHPSPRCLSNSRV